MNGPEDSQPAPDWRAIASDAVNTHRAVQDPNELAALLWIASDAGPRTVLEIGTFNGGTAWALSQLPTVETIITVDLKPEPGAGAVLAGLRPAVWMLRADSTRQETADEVKAQLGEDDVDLLFIDGAHDLASVRADWRLYRRLVAPGGIVAFHDVTPHVGQPDVQVHVLWDQIRPYYRTSKIEHNPGVWAGIGIVWM